MSSPSLPVTAGVDVGGTFIKYGLLRGSRILAQASVATDRLGKSAAAVQRNIFESVQSLSRQHRLAPHAVGVGVPGLVEYPAGIVRTCTNLPGWNRVPLRKILRQKFKLPVQVENDVHVMTLAEWHYGAGRGANNLLCVTLGTGVGGGLVLDGRLFRSGKGPSAEIGHVPINEEGPRCACGGRACLERYVGNRAVLENVRTDLRQGQSSKIRKLVGGHLNRVTPEIIDRACELGDAYARSVWRRCGERIGLALVQAIHMFSPDRIVIGGGLAQAGHWLFDPMRKTVAQRLMRGASKVPILPAKLGNSAGLIGAGALGREALLKLLVLGLSVSLSHAAFAQEDLAAGSEKEPVVVRADQVEYMDGARKVVAVGNVEAIYKTSKLTCDHAVIYMETKDAYLKGRVRLTKLGALLKGEEMVYNFETGKGIIIESELEAGPWRARADRAMKLADDALMQNQGYLTACDFEQPHTRMRAKQIHVFLDDKVVLKNILMYVGNVPVFYLPSYTHPLDDKRPRVTIIPGKDKEWGSFVLTSWRVYLHENLQGRFHVDYRERLDLATGLDIKYNLPVGGEGVFREYYTHQRSIQRKHLWSGLTSNKPGDPTVEKERWRFQLRHVWEPDEATRATLEYHKSADPTVVHDFFEREFEDNGASPPSYLQVIRTGPWYGLTFLVNKRVNRHETVTEQLPSINFNLRPFEVPWLPSFNDYLAPLGRKHQPEKEMKAAKTFWYYLSSYKYEHSDVGHPIEGTKQSLVMFDTIQEVFHPMRLFSMLNMRPFFRFRQTSFSRGQIEDAPQFRQAASTGFDLSTKFFRVFPIETNIWGLNIQRLRHVVTPNLQYEYQAKPTISADKLLRSDGLAKSNRLTPSLENKFQTKRGTKTLDLGRWVTSMPYDIEGAGGTGGEWQPMTTDVELLPYSWMRVESDAAVDPHIGKFTTINADLVIHPGVDSGNWAGRRISEVVNADTGTISELPWAVGLGWRYQRNSSAALTLETEFDLTKKWRLGIYHALDVKRFSTEVTTTGTRTTKKIYDFPEVEYRLRRDLHEWWVELLYNVTRGQGETLLLLFRLKAAPETPFEFERSYHRPKAGRNFRR